METNKIQPQSTFEKFAIIETGGKQYQALEGKTIAIEKIEGEPGDEISFDKVLLRKINDTVEVGKPYLEKAVKATIVKHLKGPKVVVFKFKRRKKSRVKKGHRQSMTIIRVETL